MVIKHLILFKNVKIDMTRLSSLFFFYFITFVGKNTKYIYFLEPLGSSGLFKNQSLESMKFKV